MLDVPSARLVRAEVAQVSTRVERGVRSAATVPA
jgi:hypothetical protein